MKDNETLKYHEREHFNSENLQQYDVEGQKYFLGYLLRKGYNVEIKEKEIIFTDITSENKIKEVIDSYNNETRIENLNIKRQAVREIRVMGLEEYSQTIEKKLRSLKRKEQELKER